MESAIQQIHGKLPSVIKEHYFINTLVTGVSPLHILLSRPEAGSNLRLS
jgi:hypothetical protein